jgi:autotransporter-associated beta strand protein
VNGTQALTYTSAEGNTTYTGGSNYGVVIGSGSSGTMIITGGTFSTLGSGGDVIGNGAGFSGTLTINGGTFIGSDGTGTNGYTNLGIGGGPTSTLNMQSGLARIVNLKLNNTTGIINLDGGTLEVNTITRTLGTNTINFNGGTLKARIASTTFLADLASTTAKVKNGGAIINTSGDSGTGVDVTIAEALLEDAGSTGGGLTKNGLGLLTLTQPSTTTGAADINAGGLAVKAGAASWAPSSFSHSGNTLNFNLGVYNPSNPVVINTGALTVDSAITVNVTGSNFQVGQIPLIAYTSKNFTGGSFTLNPATLPANVVANLVDNNTGLIYLNVTAAPTTYVWSGDTTTPGTGIWDTSSLTWNNFTTAFSTSGTQIVQFPDLAGGGTVTITGDNSPISIALANASGNNYVFNGTGKITGATVVNKTGAGKVTFNGAAHSYSGTTAISTGAIIKQAADAATGAITVANNATFALDGGVTTGAGQTITLNGPGALGADYFYTGSAAQRGSLQAQNGANTWNGNVVVTSTSNTRIGVQEGASLTIGGNITESIAGVSPTFRAGAVGNNITLNGVCSWTGDTIMFSTGGSIKLGGNDRLPTGSKIKFTGSATVFDLNGHNQQTLGVTDFNPTVTNGGATPSILTLSPLIATSIGFSGVIVDGAQSISLQKSGDGTSILDGTNTYSGTTTVNGGTLLINGNQSGATGPVQVNAGTLGGIGAVGGAVTVAATGTIAPGASTGVLTVPSADLSAGGTLAIEINDASSPKVDKLTVTGALNVTNAKLAFSVTGALAEPTYVIATGTITGTIAPGNVTGLPSGYDLVQNGTEIKLVAATGSPFGTWIDGYPSITGLDKLPAADPDKDGVNNITEFALDGNPASGASTGKLVGKIATVGGSPTLIISLPVRTGATFSGATEQVSALIDGVTYKIQGSDELTTWNLIVSEVADPDKTTIESTLPAVNTGWTRRTFQSPGAITGDPKEFLRAVIIEAP